MTVSQDGEPNLLADSWIIAYGSATGNAESISQLIRTESQEKSLGNCQVMTLDGLLEYIESTNSNSTLPVLVFITATTGDGDPPDNAKKFFKYLRRNASSQSIGFWDWSKVRYALLGLGDTNYNQFCNSAKTLEQRLMDAQATQFYISAFADDATGLERTVDPWIAGLWNSLKTQVKLCTTPSVVIENGCKPNGQVEVLSSKFSPNLDKEVAQATVALSNLQLHTGQDLYSLPESTCYTFEKLYLSLLPSELPASVTNLPKPPLPTFQLKPTGITFPVSPNVKTFYDRFVSPVLGKAVPPFSQCNPTWAQFQTIETLTSPTAAKRSVAVHLNIGPENSEDFGLWQPGDAIGVCAPIPHNLALSLAFHFNGARQNDQGIWISDVFCILPLSDTSELPMAFRSRPKCVIPVEISDAMATQNQLPRRGYYYSMYELLRYIFDPTSIPKKSLLRYLYDIVPKESQLCSIFQFLCSKQGAETYRSWIKEQQPGLLHLVESAKIAGLSWDLATLLSQLSPLSPRYYSFTSSPIHKPHTISCVFNVTQYSLPSTQEDRSGIASTWLSKHAAGDLVPVFLHPSLSFHLPNDESIPLILIGVGTGIAPIMSFLDHRYHQNLLSSNLNGPISTTHTSSPIYVFHGCRNAEKDWLFKSTLSKLVETGIITKYHVAFSQYSCVSNSFAEVSEGYVQVCLSKQKRLLGELLLKQQAKVFVCGAASGMPLGVRQVIGESLFDYCKEFNDSTEPLLSGDDLVKQLIDSKRYLQELW
jgi:methionine synthase reductase